MEKKKAERERLKAEKERLKQEVKAQQEKDTANKNIPEPQEDIVDALLKEIRAGTTLRTSTGDTGQRPNRCILKKEDIEKLEQMKQEGTGLVKDSKEETKLSEKTKQKKERTKMVKDDQEVNRKEDAENTVQMSQENMQTTVVENLQQEINGEDTIKHEQKKQEKEENMNTIVEDLEEAVSDKDMENLEQMKQKQKRAAMTIILEDLETSEEDTESVEQMNQENLTRIAEDLEQKVSGEDPEEMEQEKQIAMAVGVEQPQTANGEGVELRPEQMKRAKKGNKKIIKSKK